MSGRERILVIRVGAVGDFILSLPAVARIQRAFPNAELHLMGYPAIGALGVGRGYFDKVWRFDRADVSHLFIAEGNPPDSAAELFGQFDRIFAFLSDPKRTVEGNLRRLCQGSVFVFDPMPKNAALHAADHLLAGLDVALPGETVDLSGNQRTPTIHLKRDDVASAEEFWARHDLEGRRVLSIHPGSGSAKKNWPADRFAAVAETLRRECDVALLLVAGPADCDVRDEVLKRSKVGPSAIAEGLPLPNLAAMLQRCALHIGNDSGISHLAAAVGTATVALFGPTDERVWAPRGQRVGVVAGTCDCRPCDRETRDSCSRAECMRSIEVDQVLRVGRSMLDSSSEIRRRDKLA